MIFACRKSFLTIFLQRGATGTVWALRGLYGRYGDCTGATETVRALRRLYGRYEDCTDATKTVRALRRLYGRYGDCTGSSSSMAGLMTEIRSRDGIWVYFSFFLYVGKSVYIPPVS
jgi:hypothetical protein